MISTRIKKSKHQTVAIGDWIQAIDCPIKFEVAKVVDDIFWCHQPSEISTNTLEDYGLESTGIVVKIPESKIARVGPYDSLSPQGNSNGAASALRLKTKADVYKSDTPDILDVNFKHIPDILKECPRWFLWAFGQPDKNGKRPKVPLQCKLAKPEYVQKHGLLCYRASSTEPRQWTTYELAVRFYNKHKAKGLAGLGIALGKLNDNDNLHLCGVDLDECFTKQGLTDWAQAIVDTAETYMEISPSKTGLKGYCLADPDKVKNLGTQRKFDQGHLELYHTARYFCITGHKYNDFDVYERTAWFAGLHAAPQTATVDAGTHTNGDDKTWTKQDSFHATDTDSGAWLKEYSGDLRTLDVEGLWLSKGLVISLHKPEVWHVQCPNHEHHSDPSQLGGTVLYHHADQYPVVHCNHTQCGEFKLREALAWFGKELVDKHCTHVYGKKSASKPEPAATPQLMTYSGLVQRSKEAPAGSYWAGVQFSSLMLLSSLPNAGKTEIILNLVASTLDCEVELWGHKLEPCHYLFFDPENHPSNTVGWFNQAMDTPAFTLRCSMEQRDENEVMDDSISFVDPQTMPSYVTMDYLEQAITQTTQAHPGKKLVVVIDTFKSCFVGENDYDENDSKYVTIRLKELKAIATKHGVLILVLHHHGWNSGRATGSHAFWSVPDAIFDYLRGYAEKEGTLVRIRVRGNNHHVYKTLRLVKAHGRLVQSKGTSGFEVNDLALFHRDPEHAITKADFIAAAAAYLGWVKTTKTANNAAQNLLKRYVDGKKLICIEGKGSNPHRYHRHPDLDNDALDELRTRLMNEK